MNEAALDPFARLGAWLDDAAHAGIAEPAAMTLATATPDGAPSARIVLLRGLDPSGLVFYTNYDSRKGDELAANPRAALAFYWGPLARQVRVEGHVTRLAADESDRYFAQRPRGHQLSAWASRQSSVIPNRAYLEERVREAEQRFAGGDVPAAAVLGRLPARPHALRVLGGTAGPHARSHRLPARRRRLANRTPLPVDAGARHHCFLMMTTPSRSKTFR